MNDRLKPSTVHVTSALVAGKEELSPVICVDLDGTIIRTDTMAEALIAAIRKNPFVMLLLPLWLLQGRTKFKAELARRSEVDVTLLPYNTDVLAYLAAQRQRGTEVWLTTAAHGSHAHAVAQHLGIFTKVLSSNESINLKGKRKRLAIQELLQGRPFVYAGDSTADLPLWRACRAAITVNVPASVSKTLAKEKIPIEAAFSAGGSVWKAWITELRIYQWSKNMLVFVPILLGHELHWKRFLFGGLGFLAFSLCASGLYLLNDLLDIEVDRAHPRKKRRPFAAGRLSITDGMLALGYVLVIVFSLSYCLPVNARWLLALYAVLNLAYSVRLKQVLCLDVLVLAFLYTLRILFGGAVASITVSVWTLAFSVFLFLGLALLKRLTELKTAGESGAGHLARRPYIPVDTSIVQSFASSALYVSVLVMALYINSPEVLKLYSRPEPLWLVCLLITFWVSRMLILTNRGRMTDDPIVFAFKDRSSHIVIGLITICVFLAL